MSGNTVGEGIALLREAVDVLLGADLELDASTGDAAGVVGVIRDLEVQRRRLEAVDAAVLSIAGQRHAAAHLGRASMPDLLMHAVRLAPGEARARIRRAGDLGPRRAITGDELDPIHPVLAAAQRVGDVSGTQIDMITRAIGRIPADIAGPATPVAEAVLTEAARHEGPHELRQTIDGLLIRLDPDGDEPRDDAVHRDRFASLVRRAGGAWTLRGSLTDETGLLWRTIIDALAKPTPAAQPGDAEPVAVNAGSPAPAGVAVRDERSAGQREHDALRDLAERILRSGTLPDAGGAPVTVLVRADLADLADPAGVAGVAVTEHGDTMRTRNLLHLAGDAALVPVLFDRTRGGCPLWLGRTKRLASRAQRRALAARDGGCSFPACTRPASWCEVHHVVEWQDLGTTDVDSMTLVCGYHHRSFEGLGWRVSMPHGRPEWTPPPWIDPHCRPQSNTVHHLPEIVFRPDGSIVARR